MGQTERNLAIEMVRKELAECGYVPVRQIYLDKLMRYRVFVIAINELADILQKDPYRIYQRVLCRARRVACGAKKTPYKHEKPTQEGVRDWVTRQGGLTLVCPNCGKDLMTCGSMSKEEVASEIALRKVLTKVPTSEEK